MKIKESSDPNLKILSGNTWDTCFREDIVMCPFILLNESCIHDYVHVTVTFCKILYYH